MIKYEFVLLETENEKANKIIRKWNKEYQKRTRQKDFGVSVTFLLTPTGIGTGVSILNSYTGEVVDITDYGNW